MSWNLNIDSQMPFAISQASPNSEAPIIHGVYGYTHFNRDNNLAISKYTFQALSFESSAEIFEELDKPLPSVAEIKASVLKLSTKQNVSSISGPAKVLILTSKSVTITDDQDGEMMFTPLSGRLTIIAYPHHPDLPKVKNAALEELFRDSCTGIGDFFWLSRHPTRLIAPIDLVELDFPS